MDFFKSYLTKVSLITFLLLVFVASFNALVDPFDFFDGPVINNFNQQKPEFQSHMRMTKAHQIRLQKPEIIILGSSRADTGLNPNHPGFSVPQSKRYNTALHSANIYEVFRYLQHAQSIHPLKQVILGLDFFMFNINKKNEADFVEERLAPMKTGWIKDIFQALFTYDGLLASINTIEKQDKTGILYFPNGFKNDNQNWEQIQKKGGHHQAAINNEKDTLYALDGFTFFALSNKEQQSKSINTFIEIITFCKKNNIDLRVFISPMHVRKIQLLHQIGLWSEFENWKKRLVQLIETNTPDYSLWDFTGYNEITTEPFPLLGDTETQMKWYWESSHYKKETGDLILSKVLNNQSNPTVTDHFDFGSKLSSSTIELHLNKIRNNRDQFQTNHPEIVKEIHQMIIKTAFRRNKIIQQHPNLKPLNYLK